MGMCLVVKWGNWSAIGDYSQTLQNRFKDFYLANLKINLMAFELNATAQTIAVEAESNSNSNDPKIVNIINSLNSYRLVQFNHWFFCFEMKIRFSFKL